MDRHAPKGQWFWVTLMLSSVTIVAGVFAAWELVQNHFFRATDYVSLHYLYITRGIASSLLLAVWAAWYVLRQRRWREEELRLSREHYRRLLEASPGAVALYDSSLKVSEWNATAERLYGFGKEEVVGKTLPTIPPAQEAELRGLLQRVQAGESILDIETLRRDARGTAMEVQLSLLPFSDATGQEGFLEVTSDIRERVRLRQKLFEIEKLASMGKMAAGTAHHLNTPLAAMLLRVQMMRGRGPREPQGADLERLEASIRFCQQFVQRLLDFSRRPPLEKQPEEISLTLQSVANFLAPSWMAKRAQVSFELTAADGKRVLADRNQLEAVFTILLSNALDAISPGGRIAILCRHPSADWLEIQITDNGCGIPPQDLPHVFEPFFSTKGPGKGTGLGLAIARNIVLEHGGAVDLTSTPQQGTTAFVRLPLYQPAPAAQGTAA